MSEWHFPSLDSLVGGRPGLVFFSRSVLVSVVCVSQVSVCAACFSGAFVRIAHISSTVVCFRSLNCSFFGQDVEFYQETSLHRLEKSIDFIGRFVIIAVVHCCCLSLLLLPFSPIIYFLLEYEKETWVSYWKDVVIVSICPDFTTIVSIVKSVRVISVTVSLNSSNLRPVLWSIDR